MTAASLPLTYAIGAAAILAAATMASAPARAAGDAQADGEALTNQEAQKDLAEFADCVVSKKGQRGKVDAFLRTVPNSAGFYPASMQAADMTCLNAAAVRRRASKLQMKLQPEAFRTALYPALYRQRFGKGAVPGVAAVSPRDPASEFDAAGGGLADDYLVQRTFGDCVARAAPAGVHALLLARPYSPAEDAALAQVTPALPTCLARGTTVRMTRDQLRAATGEAMYKLAIAAPASGADSGTAG